MNEHLLFVYVAMSQLTISVTTSSGVSISYNGITHLAHIDAQEITRNEDG